MPPLSFWQAWLNVVQHETNSSDRNNNQAHAPRESSNPDDWTTGHAPLIRRRSSFANPNDEDISQHIVVEGDGPGRRAGHSATAVNRRFFYVFGGSCGSDYLNDFFVLDTDTLPIAVVTEPTSFQLFERRIRHFYNNDEFSDVIFLVEGQRVFGHKMILSIVSDCFRAMFTTGFRESEAGAEIEIPGCSYDAFCDMLNYIYTGQTPRLQTGQDGVIEVQRVIDLLEIADQFMMDHLKQVCERILQPTVNIETVEYILEEAQKTNAAQLVAVCEHFIRNQGAASADDETQDLVVVDHPSLNL